MLQHVNYVELKCYSKSDNQEAINKLKGNEIVI